MFNSINQIPNNIIENIFLAQSILMFLVCDKSTGTKDVYSSSSEEKLVQLMKTYLNVVIINNIWYIAL